MVQDSSIHCALLKFYHHNAAALNDTFEGFLCNSNLIFSEVDVDDWSNTLILNTAHKSFQKKILKCLSIIMGSLN